jgi:hypothetical protein
MEVHSVLALPNPLAILSVILISYSKPYGDEISYSNTRNDFYAIVTGFHGIDLPLMVCGRDNGTGPVTSTATVVAGSEVGFKAWSGPEDNPYTGYDKIIHPGPGQVYLSKVPEGVSVGDYDGSGDWFKVAYAGPKDDKEWSLYGTPEMRFNLPEKTPPGKYLMRMEFFMPSLSVDPMGPQWYVSCAHVEVVGPGGGQLKDKDLIRFPEGYDMFDPGEFYLSSLIQERTFNTSFCRSGNHL